MKPEVPIVSCLVLAAVACVHDVRSRRIPNWLTFGGAALAMLASVTFDGLGGLRFSVGGWAAGCLLFLPVYLLGGMGAGDVKLLAALGAWLGAARVLWVALYGGVAGGVLALLVLLGAGTLRQALRNIGYLFSYWHTIGLKPVPTLTLADAKSPRLPYAIPIGVGLMVALWLR